MTNSLQFVDSIASSPGTRLDLGDGTTWRVLRDGTDFSPPPLRRVVASNQMENGARIPSAVHDLRVIRLELLLDGTTADATATQEQTLYRELDRPEGNILRYWDNVTNPIFFRTFRCTPSAVSSRLTTNDGKKKQISVELLAEPYGYGLLETPVSAATLNTDPALSNGCFVDVTGVKGDVLTPALIRWPSSAVVANRESLFALRRHGTPSAAPFLWQAENLTNGTDTSDTVNASFSNGNGTRTTFATSSMTTRLTLSDLGTASVDLRGRYRVFARYAKTVSGDTMTVRVAWGTSGGETTVNDSVILPSGTSVCMADLGEIQIPRGFDPTTNFRSGVQVAASDTYHLVLQASRTGSGNLDVDYLLLVPSDEGLGILKWVEAGPDRWWLDAEDNNVHARNSSDQIATAAPTSPAGGFPWLAPNQTNRVFMVYEVGAGLATTLTTVAVTVSYFPLYLRVRPAST